MKNENVRKLETALSLNREIVGVKFIDYKDDFDKLDTEVPDKKGPFCYLVREAMEGKVLKIDENTIACDYSKYALGITKPNSAIKEGRSYYHAGLYESNSIAKDIVDSMGYSEHKIHGVLLGPLELIEDADIVIIVDYAQTIMRVMQSYAYKFGNPKNLSFFGNQAMCADLVAKPYKSNDINISLMCKGMRSCGRFDKGELGVGLPINMFDSLTDGAVKTINPVNTPKEKKDILESKPDDLDLGVDIDCEESYGIRLKEYGEFIQNKSTKL